MGRFICALIVVLFLVAGCGEKPEVSIPGNEEPVAAPQETATEVEMEEEVIPAVFPEEALANVADALSEDIQIITEEDIEMYPAAYAELCSVLEKENVTQQMLDEAVMKHGYEDYFEFDQVRMNLLTVCGSLNNLMMIEELSGETQPEVIDEIEGVARSLIEAGPVSREDLELVFEHWDVLKPCTID